MVTNVLYLGRVVYGTALELQRTLLEMRKSARIENTLLLLEHPPVITLGRNARLANVLAPPEFLAQQIEIDVTEPSQLLAAATALTERWDRMDGLLHAIGYAPPECLGGDMFQAGWDEVQVALHVSAYSLKALVEAFRPLLVAAGRDGGVGASVVGLDFDASVAWPAYDWMGVSKAALESISRYLARDLGPDRIRVNLVAAGPVKTLAAKSIPGFAAFEDTWADRAPLGWDVLDADVVARACVALFSDLLPMTTGEILHVDGGLHATGA